MVRGEETAVPTAGSTAGATADVPSFDNAAARAAATGSSSLPLPGALPDSKSSTSSMLVGAGARGLPGVKSPTARPTRPENLPYSPRACLAAGVATSAVLLSSSVSSRSSPTPFASGDDSPRRRLVPTVPLVAGACCCCCCCRCCRCNRRSLLAVLLLLPLPPLSLAAAPPSAITTLAAAAALEARLMWRRYSPVVLMLGSPRAGDVPPCERGLPLLCVGRQGGVGTYISYICTKYLVISRRGQNQTLQRTILGTKVVGWSNTTRQWDLVHANAAALQNYIGVLLLMMA